MNSLLKKGLDFNIGPIFLPGQRPNKTGNWRVFRPELNMEKCNMCLLCWIYCPDGTIKRLEDALMIDYDFCKGCGICEAECRAGAIKMIRE